MSGKRSTLYKTDIIKEKDSKELYKFLKHNVDWGEGIKAKGRFHTRKQCVITENDTIIMKWIKPVITKAIKALTDEYTYKDLQFIYLNYYKDGNDYTPAHSHKDSNQIVISLGAVRTLKIGNKEIEMENGSAVIFGTSVHSVPKEENVKRGRISIALFFPKVLNQYPHEIELSTELKTQLLQFIRDNKII